MLRHRWPHLSAAAVVSHLALFLVLLVCLRTVDGQGSDVPWLLVLAVFSVTRLVTIVPITPGALGVAELSYVAGSDGGGGRRRRCRRHRPAVPVPDLVRADPARHGGMVALAPADRRRSARTRPDGGMTGAWRRPTGAWRRARARRPPAPGGDPPAPGGATGLAAHRAWRRRPTPGRRCRGAVTALTAWAVAPGTVGAAERAVFRFVNGWPDAVRWPLWAFQTLGVLGVPLLVAAGALALRRWRLAAALIALVPLKLAVEHQVLKLLVHRERPGTTVPGAVLRDVPSAGASFPSGHAIVAFGVVVLLLPYLRHRWQALVVAARRAERRGAHLPGRTRPAGPPRRRGRRRPARRRPEPGRRRPSANGGAACRALARGPPGVL